MLRSGINRPLTSKPQHRVDEVEFHRVVFAAHGKKCHFRSQKRVRRLLEDGTGKLVWSAYVYVREAHEKCLGAATDAMHVVDRSRIGPKHAYFEPKANGRPGCRACHELQTAGCLEFSDTDYNAAIRALNRHMKVPLRER